MITALVGIMLALAIGIACRCLDIPVPHLRVCRARCWWWR